jgi:hypothetical protein
MRYVSKPEAFENTEFVRRGEIEKKQKEAARVQGQFKAMLSFAKIIEECIKDAGEAGIPSGHLYAAMMHKVGLETYQYAIGILKDAGVITEQNHLLRWTRN